jgi:hypothetical protein
VDVRLFMRVLWRFKFLTALGLIAAVALAALSLVSVSFQGGSVTTHYRGAEKWVSRTTVLVTERRFPLGRSVLDDPTTTSSSVTTTTPTSQPFAPSERFTELANIYAELATSDAVRQYMLKDGPILGTIDASALSTFNQAPLPLVSIGGTGITRSAAAALAGRASQALREYIEIKQRDNGIPKEQRVVLTVIKEPRVSTATLLVGRSKTMPIVVFLVVMLGVTGLAFLLENMRPQMRAVTVEPETAAADEPRARRLA